PRFVIRKGKRLTWIEVRGAVLVTASGATGTAPTPTERACTSEQAALRERDKLMAELVSQNDELEAFGAKEKPAAQRRSPPLGALKSHPELEAQLAADPDDAGTWMVYEDWLLAQHDPRSALIEREHAGEHKDAAVERGK